MGLFKINIILLIIICVFYNLDLYLSQKPNFSFRLRTGKLGVFLRLLFFITFFFYFVVFFRFLNLFRSKPDIQLIQIFLQLQNYSILTLGLMFFIFVLALKILVNFFKVSFLRVHYYLMNNDNFMYWDEYAGIVYFFATWHNRFILYLLYKDIVIIQSSRNLLYYFFKYFFTLVIFFVFFVEVFFCNCVLHYFLLLLPWYSLYKLIYNLNYFLIYKLDYFYDCLISSVLYPENKQLEKQFYIERIEFVDEDFRVINQYIRTKLFK